MVSKLNKNALVKAIDAADRVYLGIDEDEDAMPAAYEEAIRAYLASPPEPVQVGVKELEWHPGSSPIRSVADFCEKPMYEVGIDRGKWYWAHNWLGISVTHVKSEEAAKSAAQADYEQRIRSCILTPAQPANFEQAVEAIARLIDPVSFSCTPSSYGLADDDTDGFHRTMAYGAQLGAIDKAKTILAVLPMLGAGQERQRWQKNMQAHAAAMRMVCDAIEELFGPTASLESDDASLLQGPELHHRAEGVVEALQRVRAALGAGQEKEVKAVAWKDATGTELHNLILNYQKEDMIAAGGRQGEHAKHYSIPLYTHPAPASPASFDDKWLGDGPTKHVLPEAASPAVGDITEEGESARRKLELWFFRDLTDEKRLALFSLFGMPIHEIDQSLGHQRKALRHVIAALEAASLASCRQVEGE